MSIKLYMATCVFITLSFQQAQKISLHREFLLENGKELLNHFKWKLIKQEDLLNDDYTIDGKYVKKI